MRIVYTSRVDPLHREGVGNFHHNKLAEEAKRRGWELTVLTTALESHQRNNVIIDDGLLKKVFLGGTSPDRLTRGFGSASRKYVDSTGAYQIAICSAFSGLGLLSREWPNMRRITFLHNSWSTIHPPSTDRPLSLRKVGSRFRDQLAWRRSMVRLLDSGSAIAVPSHFTKRAVLEDLARSRVRIQDEAVAVVHNGVSPLSFLSPATGVGKKLSSPISLVTIGRLHPQKGLETAIRAVAVLRDRGVICELSIYGPEQDRGYSEWLRRLCKRLNLEDRVNFAGGLTSIEVQAVFGQADFALFPSNSDEGLSFALIEAMQVGTVPIASRSGGNVEVLEGILSELLIEKGDYLALALIVEKLAGAPETYSAFAANVGKRVATDFSLETHLSALVELAR